MDYAATTLVDPRVIVAINRCFGRDGILGNAASRSHSFGWKAEKAVERAREQVADLILGLSVTWAAKGLGLTRQALSELVNGNSGVSIEMAIRLSKAFGSTPETWLGMQMAYDLWQARGRTEQIAVERFAAA